MQHAVQIANVHFDKAGEKLPVVLHRAAYAVHHAPNGRTAHFKVARRLLLYALTMPARAIASVWSASITAARFRSRSASTITRQPGNSTQSHTHSNNGGTTKDKSRKTPIRSSFNEVRQ